MARIGGKLFRMAFSSRAFCFCQGGETKREVLRRTHKSGTYWILCDVSAMVLVALQIIHSCLRKASLPNLSRVSSFPSQSEGKPSLDELHGLLDGHVALDRSQQMHMIGHNHKIMHLEFFRFHVRTKYIDEQHRIALRLQ